MPTGNGTPPNPRNPYLFVVGCPRSGTTLLQRMLDHHPQLTVANDTHFIPRALHKYDRGGAADPVLTPELIDRVRQYHRFHRLGVGEAEFDVAADAASTYAELVSGLYTARGRQHGKPLSGEKTPDYVRCLPLLHGLFPNARSLHIIRDGRDVALSALQWAKSDKGPGRIPLWQDEPVAVCALWWRSNVANGMRDGAEIGAERYHAVSYERLVDDPEQTLREVTGFLKLPFAREMLEYHVGKQKTGRSAKSAWLPPTGGLRDWRTELADRDVELFEALAGETLTELNYERAFPVTSPAVAAVADRCQRWWEASRWYEPRVFAS